MSDSSRMSILEYEREFLRLSRYAKNMFPTEKEMCDKFKWWGLRDEIHAFVAAYECKTLVELTAKAHKMESIIKDRSKNFKKERMKRGRSSPLPPSSFKRLKD
ncbi:Hexaprenyldihydroxybenzoate methyltransferase, mitochondrial-like protein [Gossypium australe]|uniref:Hexaprenyldihydroxybenzoate methyltransferase, mitochondrial-like protein n=1 Tax=Gossypium australe TaxID=47621 RepID=A0A5B6UQE9_9ROSI|nr:Hexaprenyldihydroxybenzoate methyltransferase, mitochondrial-like protein [Gossypium australe]